MHGTGHISVQKWAAALVVAAVAALVFVAWGKYGSGSPAATTVPPSGVVTQAQQFSPVTSPLGSTTTSSEPSPVSLPGTAAATTPDIAMLQSEISDEESVVIRDTAVLQADQAKLESDTQWCNDPAESGPSQQIGQLPCSTQLGVDKGAVSADTQELSQAQATLETEEQELSATG